MKLHTTKYRGTRAASPMVLAGETQLARVLVRTTLALLLCFAAAFLVAAPPLSAAEAKRVLFILDTSASMKPFEKTVRETIFDLVSTGMHGYMTNGDTYGVWFVGDQNDTSFPMESWKSRFNVELGARVPVRIKEHGFKGKARLDLAFEDAMRVVKSVGDLTIVLISNGETPIAGTAHDADINARFAELAPVMKKNKLTIHTVFVAQEGALVAWAMNGPDHFIDVPNVPPKPKRTAPVTNLVAKVVPPAPAAPVVTNVAPPKPRIAPNPIIITKETVAQDRRILQALTTTGMTNELVASPVPANTNTVTGTKVATNSAAVPAVVDAPEENTTATPAIAVATNVVETTPALAATNAPAPQIDPVIANANTNRLETNSVTLSAKAEPATNVTAAVTTSAASPAASANAAAPLAATTPAEGSIQPALWATIGAGAAILGMLVVALLFRVRRREPSLISQTLVRERAGSVSS